jgi:hypothetical protein
LNFDNDAMTARMDDGQIVQFTREQNEWVQTEFKIGDMNLAAAFVFRLARYQRGIAHADASADPDVIEARRRRDAADADLAEKIAAAEERAR